VEVDLVTRRMEQGTNEDPIQELMEVYEEVNEIENNFRKCCNITSM